MQWIVDCWYIYYHYSWKHKEICGCFRKKNFNSCRFSLIVCGLYVSEFSEICCIYCLLIFCICLFCIIGIDGFLYIYRIDVNQILFLNSGGSINHWLRFVYTLPDRGKRNIIPLLDQYSTGLITCQNFLTCITQAFFNLTSRSVMVGLGLHFL